MLLLDRAFETARKKNYKIVFPERDDQRIFDAAKFLTKEKLAKIVWLENTRITSSHLETIKKQRPNIKENFAKKTSYEASLFSGRYFIFRPGRCNDSWSDEPYKEGYRGCFPDSRDHKEVESSFKLFFNVISKWR